MITVDEAKLHEFIDRMLSDRSGADSVTLVRIGRRSACAQPDATAVQPLPTTSLRAQAWPGVSCGDGSLRRLSPKRPFVRHRTAALPASCCRRG